MLRPKVLAQNSQKRLSFLALPCRERSSCASCSACSRSHPRLQVLDPRFQRGVLAVTDIQPQNVDVPVAESAHPVLQRLRLVSLSISISSASPKRPGFRCFRMRGRRGLPQADSLASRFRTGGAWRCIRKTRTRSIFVPSRSRARQRSRSDASAYQRALGRGS